MLALEQLAEKLSFSTGGWGGVVRRCDPFGYGHVLLFLNSLPSNVRSCKTLTIIHLKSRLFHLTFASA